MMIKVTNHTMGLKENETLRLRDALIKPRIRYHIFCLGP